MHVCLCGSANACASSECLIDYVLHFLKWVGVDFCNGHCRNIWHCTPPSLSTRLGELCWSTSMPNGNRNLQSYATEHWNTIVIIVSHIHHILTVNADTGRSAQFSIATALLLKLPWEIVPSLWTLEYHCLYYQPCNTFPELSHATFQCSLTVHCLHLHWRSYCRSDGVQIWMRWICFAYTYFLMDSDAKKPPKACYLSLPLLWLRITSSGPIGCHAPPHSKSQFPQLNYCTLYTLVNGFILFALCSQCCISSQPWPTPYSLSTGKSAIMPTPG